MKFVHFIWLVDAIVADIGWAITVWYLMRANAIVKEMAPWIATKRIQDEQDFLLASLTPTQQQKVIARFNKGSLHSDR